MATFVSVNERSYFQLAQDFCVNLRRLDDSRLASELHQWVGKYTQLQDLFASASEELSGRGLEVLQQRHQEIERIAQRLFPSSQRANVTPSVEQRLIAQELRIALNANRPLRECFQVFNRLSDESKNRAYQLLCEVHSDEPVPVSEIKKTGIDLFLANHRNLLATNPTNSTPIIDQLIQELTPRRTSPTTTSSQHRDLSPGRQDRSSSRSRRLPSQQPSNEAVEQRVIAQELRTALGANRPLRECYQIFIRLTEENRNRAYQLLCEVHCDETIPQSKINETGIDLFLKNHRNLLTRNPTNSIQIIDQLIQELTPPSSPPVASSRRRDPSPTRRRNFSPVRQVRSSNQSRASQRQTGPQIFSTGLPTGPSRRTQQVNLPPPPSARPTARILEPTLEDFIFAMTSFGNDHGIEFVFDNLEAPVRHSNFPDSDPSSGSIFPAKVNRFAQQLRAKLSHDDQGHFDLFLENFLGMKDCENERGKRKALAKLEQLLEGACQNQKFRKTMVSLMPQANASCGDRFSYYFGEMETHWHIACDPKAQTPEGLAKLLIGLRRKKLLDEHAEALARRLGNEEEEIETMVALRAAFAAEFELPVSIREIRHTGCTRLEPRDLEEARNILMSTTDIEVMAEILMQNEAWNNLIKPQADRMQKQVIRESEEVFGQVDDVEYERDQDKEDVMKDISRQRDFEARKSLKQVTLRFLRSMRRDSD